MIKQYVHVSSDKIFMFNVSSEEVRDILATSNALLSSGAPLPISRNRLFSNTFSHKIKTCVCLYCMNVCLPGYHFL